MIRESEEIKEIEKMTSLLKGFEFSVSSSIDKGKTWQCLGKARVCKFKEQCHISTNITYTFKEESKDYQAVYKECLKMAKSDEKSQIIKTETEKRLVKIDLID